MLSLAYVLKTVIDKDVETTVHKQEVICPMANSIAASVMTLGKCQGHSSIASYFLYWQTRRKVPLPYTELLVKTNIIQV